VYGHWDNSVIDETGRPGPLAPPRWLTAEASNSLSSAMTRATPTTGAAARSTFSPLRGRPNSSRHCTPFTCRRTKRFPFGRLIHVVHNTAHEPAGLAAMLPPTPWVSCR